MLQVYLGKCRSRGAYRQHLELFDWFLVGVKLIHFHQLVLRQGKLVETLLWVGADIV